MHENVDFNEIPAWVLKASGGVIRLSLIYRT